MRRFSCTLCDKRFYQETAATKHFEKTHCENGPHLCTLCGSSFLTSDLLTEHRPYHINYVIKKTNPKKYANIPRYESCPICGKTYAPTRKRHILIHNHIQSVHENKNDYICDICNKGFATSNKLFRHKRRHFKNEQCSICRNRVDNIKLHYETFHSNLKYTCEICYKKFQAVYYLQRHMRWAHLKKEFTCDICGMDYVDLPTIRRHVKIHIGGRVTHGRCKVSKINSNRTAVRRDDFEDSDQNYFR